MMVQYRSIVVHFQSQMQIVGCRVHHLLYEREITIVHN